MKDNKPLAIGLIVVIVLALGFLATRALMGNNASSQLSPEDATKYGVPPPQPGSKTLPPIPDEFAMDKGGPKAVKQK